MKVIASIGECMAELSHDEANRYSMTFAGDALNVLWYARAISNPSTIQTRFISAVGDDEISGKLLSFLSTNGIDVSRVLKRTDRTIGLYLISLGAGGERSFTYWRSQSAARTLAASASALAASLEGTDCVVFSGITLAILDDEQRDVLFDCLSARKQAGAVIAFDSNIRPRMWRSSSAMLEATERAYRLATFAIPTFEDEAAICGDASPASLASRIRGYGVDEVVVKNGAKSCVISKGDEITEVPAEPVSKPVDTTSAGDSFNGAYLASRLEGHAPAHSAQIAHKIASKVIMAKGALVDIAELR